MVWIIQINKDKYFNKSFHERRILQRFTVSLTFGSLVEDREQVDGSSQGVEHGEKSQARLQWLLFV